MARHVEAPRRHLIVRQAEHREEIPFGARSERTTLLHIRSQAPVVEVRPLDAYEGAALGCGR